MTKAKAIKLMLEYSRLVIDPSLALKISKAFGYTLSDLGMKPTKVRNFSRLNYAEEVGELTAISVYHLAEKIVEAKTGIYIKSEMHGSGSRAKDITEQAVEILKK